MGNINFVCSERLSSALCIQKKESKTINKNIQIKETICFPSKDSYFSLKINYSEMKENKRVKI